MRRFGPGPAGPLERTGVTWEAKPTGYLGPLSLGVIFCKDGSCLIGQRYVPQPEALRAQQAKEKKNGDLLWEIPVRDICGFLFIFSARLDVLHSWGLLPTEVMMGYLNGTYSSYVGLL